MHAREETCELACELARERNLVQLEVMGGLEKADSSCMGKAMHVRNAKESMHSSCPWVWCAAIDLGLCKGVSWA